MENRLPASWAVKNDGSQRFKDLVIGYLKNKYGGWGWDINANFKNSYRYYGVSYQFGDSHSPDPLDYEKILTLNDFEDLINPINPFKINHLSQPPILEPLIKPTMEKTIKMSLETARGLWEDVIKKFNVLDNGDISFKTPSNVTPLDIYIYNLLKINFTKEELEGKKGYTWEDSFDGKGFLISEYGIGVTSYSRIEEKNKIIFKTKEQALSVLAFAQLTHIVAKYNEGKVLEETRRKYEIIANEKSVFINVIPITIIYKSMLTFFDIKDAEISLEVNRLLWEQYWQISDK